jgi:hypothetical protein
MSAPYYDGKLETNPFLKLSKKREVYQMGRQRTLGAATPPALARDDRFVCLEHGI